MKKGLLLGLLAAATSLSSYAVVKGDKVDTRTGRYEIVGENILTNGTFETFAGWSAISTTEGTEVDAQFSYANADEETGAPAGIISKTDAKDEGIGCTITGTESGKTYIVSMTVWSPALVPNLNTYTGTEMSGSSQKFLITGTAGETVKQFSYNQEILPGTTELCWAIDGDDNAYEYTLALTAWSSQLRIANIKVFEANKIADPRKLIVIIDYLKAVKGMKDWASVDKADFAEDLQAMIDESEAKIESPETTQQDIDDQIASLQGSDGYAALFEDYAIDDYLPAAIDKLPLAANKVSKQAAIGNWKDDATRIHSSAGGFYDLGHFQNSNGWGNAAQDGRIGLTYYGINLVPGTYIFSVELKANSRIAVKNSWTDNEGLQVADGILTVKEVKGEKEEDKVQVATTGRYPISPYELTKKWLVFTIENEGKYDIRIDTYSKEEYNGILKCGSVVYPLNASLFAYTGAKYNKARLDYENDVRGQITAGRNNLTAATELLADNANVWGRTALSEAQTTYEPVIADYEAKTQDEIIDTYDKDLYDSSKGLEAVNEDGDYYRVMASEVYRTGTKGIIAAVNAFKAQNDTIKMLGTAIQNAETVKADRLYSKASGKAALEAAIAAASAQDVTLKSVDYSQENAAAVLAAVETLNTAVADFKVSIPADCITTLADMTTGNLKAEAGETAFELTAEGGQGKMMITAFNAETPNGHNNYGIGYIVNDENKFPTLLRVGNGEATLDFAIEEKNQQDILQVSFDMYFGNLITKYCGFYVQNIADVEGTPETTNICALYIDRYDGKATEDGNTFNVDINGKITAVGSSSEANDAIAAESNKTHVELTMDLATKKMYMNTTSSKGTTMSEKVAFEKMPTRFLLKSDYNNADRRSFFGNLKIQAISAEEPTGAMVVENEAAADNAAKVMVINNQLVVKTANGIVSVAGARIK